MISRIARPNKIKETMKLNIFIILCICVCLSTCQHLYFGSDHYNNKKAIVKESQTGFLLSSVQDGCPMETGGFLYLRLPFGLKKTIGSVAFYKCKKNGKMIVKSKIYMTWVPKSMFVSHIDNLMKEKKAQYGFEDKDLDLVDRCMKGLGDFHYRYRLKFVWSDGKISFYLNEVLANKFKLDKKTFNKFYRLLLKRYFKTIKINKD